MTLTWADIDARWPDAGVLWDRDVAPTLDWEPRFEVHRDALWAVSGTCMSNEPISTGEGPGVHMFIWMQGQRETHRTNCKCVAWCDGAWTPQSAFSQCATEAALKWHREFVDRWNALYPPSAVWDFDSGLRRDAPRRHLRGSRAQRKRKRAALLAQR